MMAGSFVLVLTGLGVIAHGALAEVLLPPQIRGGEIDLTQWAATPPGLSTEILAHGRETYSDLLDAQSAVAERDSLGLRLALGDARRHLQELSGPAQVRSLEAQMGIIRRDLGNTSKIPDNELWVPVSAEWRNCSSTLPRP